MNKDIIEIVNRETYAWDTQNVELLLSVFHADTVWVWPKDVNSHNPVDWETPMGKFDWNKWRKVYEAMFAQYSLVRNDRKTIKIVETIEQDGGFTVVDIDTLWKERFTGKEMHWHGRTCKTYVKTENGYKMIAQIGALQY